MNRVEGSDVVRLLRSRASTGFGETHVSVGGGACVFVYVAKKRDWSTVYDDRKKSLDKPPTECI